MKYDRVKKKMEGTNIMKFDKLIEKKLELTLNENSLEPVISQNTNFMKSPIFRQKSTSKDRNLNYPLMRRKFNEDDIMPNVKQF